MSAGQVCQLFQVDNEVLTLLKNFVMVAYDSGTCSKTWRTTEDHVFIYTSSIKCSLVYSNLSNDRILRLVALAFSKLKENMFAESMEANHDSLLSGVMQNVAVTVRQCKISMDPLCSGVFSLL